MNKNVFRNLSYGVYVISTWDEGRATGCTANSAMQITSSPATIAVSINHDNHTNACIKDTGRFAISILSEKSDPMIIGTFGFYDGDVNGADTPMTYAYYHNVVKGKSPKNAPTYIAEEK